MDIQRRMVMAGIVRAHYENNFPLFLHDYFAWLGFDLTDMQLDIGRYMADRNIKNKCVMAQRGEAKSTIGIARALYEFVQMPNATVLLVSGSDDYAGTLSHAIVSAIMQWDRLEWLRPESRAGARTSFTDGFDVHHAFRIPDKQPSVKAVGIFGQLQGNHVTLLIADDVETTSNGSSPANRARIATLTKEFAAIANDGAEILYLGTPQTQDSIYNSLPQRGFDVRIWPGRYPTPEEEERYGGCLAPYIKQRMEGRPELRTGYGILGNRGAQTDPQRYSEEKQLQNERDYQQAGFQLQFMLDTSLADALKQTLQLSDLIMFHGSPQSAPEVVHWSNNPRHLAELPMDFPLARTRLYMAADFSDTYVAFTDVKAFLDPGGGGTDESVIFATAAIGPYIHVLGMRVYHGGQTEDNVEDSVRWLVSMGVTHCTIEDNMGHGAVTNMYKGAAKRLDAAIGFEGIYSTGQKEVRIISRLNPIMQRHRVVMHWSVLEEDVRMCRNMPNGGREYCLFWQMQNLTTQAKCIPHDDRIEALSAAVFLHVEALQQDEHEEAQKRLEAAAREFVANPMGYSDSRWRSHKPVRGTRRRLR
nr:MAG: Terminase [Bacteriophage sp.]